MPSNLASVYVQCQKACRKTNSNTTLIFVSWCRYCLTTNMIALSWNEQKLHDPTCASVNHTQSLWVRSRCNKNELEITTEALKS